MCKLIYYIILYRVYFLIIIYYYTQYQSNSFIDYVPKFEGKDSKLLNDPNALERLLLEEKNNNSVLKSKIKELEQELQNQKEKDSNSSWKNKINEYQTLINELKKRIAQLENILIKENTKSSTLKIKVKELENELNSEKNEKKSLMLSINQLGNELKNEKTEKENTNLRFSQLQNEIDILKKEKEKISKIANQLNNDINNEKNKNELLKKKVKQLDLENSKIKNENNLSKSQTYDKKMISLYQKIDDLKDKLSRYPFELKEGERMISIMFSSNDQKISDSIICKNTDIFSEVELKLYKLYPSYSEKELFFLVNGKKVNRNKSLDFNHIRDHDKIILFETDFN